MSPDAFNIRLVIIFLGLVVLVGIGGGIYLADGGKSLPGELIALVGGAAGSLASILAKTSTGTQDVRVVDEPIEVTETVASGTPAAKARKATKAAKRT